MAYREQKIGGESSPVELGGWEISSGQVEMET
jgi:hypothetical protein